MSIYAMDHAIELMELVVGQMSKQKCNAHWIETVLESGKFCRSVASYTCPQPQSQPFTPPVPRRHGNRLLLLSFP